MPINQDMHWSLIVINKPREIFENLLAGNFMKEEEEQESIHEDETVSKTST